MELVGGWFSHQVGVMHACSTSLMGSVIITSNDTLIECVCSLIPQSYKDFVDRQDTIRQEAWHMPGWDECVLRTGIVLMSLCVCVCIYHCVVL